MTSKKKTFIGIIFGIALLMLIAFLTGYNRGKVHAEKNISRDTTTIVTSDYKAPKAEKEVGIGEISIPLVVYTDDGKQKVVYMTTKSEADTIYKNSDSLHVNIPITQKTYSDSNYVAYVSGFMPKLDSIQVKSKIITITQKETMGKYHRLNFGLTGGLGYGITTRKPDIFVGVGVTINLFKK